MSVNNNWKLLFVDEALDNTYYEENEKCLSYTNKFFMEYSSSQQNREINRLKKTNFVRSFKDAIVIQIKCVDSYHTTTIAIQETSKTVIVIG